MNDRITIFPLLTSRRNCFTMAIQLFRKKKRILLLCYINEYKKHHSPTSDSLMVLPLFCSSDDFCAITTFRVSGHDFYGI